MQTKSKATFAAAIVLVTLAAAMFLFGSKRDQPVHYRFAKVERGLMSRTISSTGTLNAVITVQVGTQVSGQIIELPTDFNSVVRAGQIIARIDPQIFDVRVQQAEAELVVARANVAIQVANLERARTELENAAAMQVANQAQTEKAAVDLEDAKRNFARKQVLYEKKVISQSQIDEAQTAFDAAAAQLKSIRAQERAEGSMVASRRAAVKMAEAQLEYSNAQVRLKEAALEQSRVDQAHTVIRSPVDGVVIERSVDIGQTVAASLQTPRLFIIAQDLRRMQVETDVDEADIGSIQVGQRATFTVDAFAGREFSGQVLQIRKAAHSIQNVVTYTVLVTADNPDLRLLPGMTADVSIVVAEHPDVLKIPNAALRFQPPGEMNKATSPGDDQGSPVSGSNAAEQGEERLKRLSEALDLSPDQQNQIRTIFAGIREHAIALHRQGAAPEEIRTALQSERERSRSAIAAILSSEQQEKFRLLAEARQVQASTKGRIWLLDDRGHPVPMAVAVGISDGNYTELISGDLHPGQEIIVGIDQVERQVAGGIQRRFGLWHGRRASQN